MMLCVKINSDLFKVIPPKIKESKFKRYLLLEYTIQKTFDIILSFSNLEPASKAKEYTN